MKRPPSAQQALIPPDENRRMFDAIARRYDLLNTIISLGRDHAWRREAVDRLQVRAGGQYVDAGCGTGALSLALARRFPAGALTVHGLDFSAAMLHEGGRRIAQAGLAASITLQQGDALALPFADSSLDGVISGFVLRNLSNRPAALVEWCRVLRPGGRCVVLELAVPESWLMRVGYRIFTRLVVPGLAWAGLFAGAEWALADPPAIPWGGPLAATLAFVAIGPAVLAYRAWGLGVQRVGPGIAGIFSNLTPLFAAVMSAAFLGEPPQGHHIVAFGLIVSGIVVSSRKPG
jgi:ubiquinone/menaquinone biosynthesis methyltransferase